MNIDAGTTARVVKLGRRRGRHRPLLANIRFDHVRWRPAGITELECRCTVGVGRLRPLPDEGA